MGTKKLPSVVVEVLRSRAKEYPKIGVAMLEWVKEGKLTVRSSSRDSFCEAVGCSVGQYYKVLGLLVSVGLIVKETPSYVFNRYFGVDVCKEWIDYLSEG